MMINGRRVISEVKTELMVVVRPPVAEFELLLRRATPEGVSSLNDAEKEIFKKLGDLAKVNTPMKYVNNALLGSGLGLVVGGFVSMGKNMSIPESCITEGLAIATFGFLFVREGIRALRSDTEKELDKEFPRWRTILRKASGEYYIENAA